MEKKLAPPIGALVAVIGFAYALWAGAAFHASAIEHNQEVGVIAMYIFLVILFAVVMAAAGMAWGALMAAFDDAVTQSAIAAVALAIFLVGYGRPSLIVLGIAAFIYVYTLRAGRKQREDEQDLADFLDQ